MKQTPTPSLFLILYPSLFVFILDQILRIET